LFIFGEKQNSNINYTGRQQNIVIHMPNLLINALKEPTIL